MPPETSGVPTGDLFIMDRSAPTLLALIIGIVALFVPWPERKAERTVKTVVLERRVQPKPQPDTLHSARVVLVALTKVDAP